VLTVAYTLLVRRVVDGMNEGDDDERERGIE